MMLNNFSRKIALQMALISLTFCLAPAELTQAQDTPVASGVSGTNASQLQRQIQSYEKAIAESDGSYGGTSAELYLSLANSYRALGDNEKAIAAYQERLQALRITLGLDSEAQLATLSSYNELLFQLGDWERIDVNFHLSHHIASKLYGHEDPRFIQSATQLASWKIKAFESGVLRDEDDRSINDHSIQEAAQIYQELAEQLPPGAEDYHNKRAEYLSAKGLAHFYAAKYFADLPIEYFQAFVSSTAGQQQCHSLVMSFDGAQPARSVCPEIDVANPDVFTAQQRTKSETVRRHLSAMRASFSDAIASIESDPSASPKKLALATLNLGDASLLAQDYGRANSQYAKAWKILSTDGESQRLRDELLNQPTQVMRGVLAEIVSDTPLRKNVLAGTISFDVIRNGEIENIDIQGSEQAFDPENIAAIAIKLDQTTFRPKIAEGKPVRSRITLNAADL
jgi:hypothetical protein